MARIRNIKPEFFLDEDLATLEPLDRLTFIGLFCQADKAGRIEDRPQRLSVQILPYEAKGFDQRLERLAAHQFIIRWQADDGRRFIQIRTWHRHQRPHHTEAESTLPPMPNGLITVKEPLTDRLTTEECNANSQGRGRGGGREGEGKGKGKEITSPTRKRAGDRALFEAFWKAYPKHIAKGAAAKAWQKLDLDLVADAVMVHLAAYEFAEDPRYVPHAATWLNREAFEEQPEDPDPPAPTPYVYQDPYGNLPDDEAASMAEFLKKLLQQEGE